MRAHLTRLILAACILGLFVPATAGAETNRHKYLELHAQCEKIVGEEPCGRNIAHEGIKKGKTERPAKAKEIAKGIKTLRNMIYIATRPAPAAAPPAETGSAPTAAAPAPSGGGGAGCTGMSAESGSDGYNAYNPNGGYIGCYQIAPMHYNGGVCSGLGTDPGGQDACAGRICNSQGAGAWTNPSGQNPCGRLGG